MQPQVAKGRGLKRIHSRAKTHKGGKKKNKVNQRDRLAKAYRVTPLGSSGSAWSTKTFLRAPLGDVTNQNHCAAREEWNRLVVPGAGPVRSGEPAERFHRGRNKPTGTSTPRARAMQHPKKEPVKLNTTKCKFPVLRLCWTASVAAGHSAPLTLSLSQGYMRNIQLLCSSHRDDTSWSTRGRVNWGMGGGEIIYILYI